MFTWITNRLYGIPHPTPNTGDFVVSGQCGKETKYKCGHRGFTHFKLLGYGEVFWDNTKSRDSQQTEICSECWLHHLKMLVIQCCVCGRPITPGNNIIL